MPSGQNHTAMPDGDHGQHQQPDEGGHGQLVAGRLLAGGDDPQQPVLGGQVVEQAERTPPAMQPASVHSSSWPSTSTRTTRRAATTMVLRWSRRTRRPRRAPAGGVAGAPALVITARLRAHRERSAARARRTRTTNRYAPRTHADRDADEDADRRGGEGPVDEQPDDQPPTTPPTRSPPRPMRSRPRRPSRGVHRPSTQVRSCGGRVATRPRALHEREGRVREGVSGRRRSDRTTAIRGP